MGIRACYTLESDTAEVKQGMTRDFKTMEAYAEWAELNKGIIHLEFLANISPEAANESAR